MAEAAYILCFLTSAAVALLLIRAYLRTRARILLWSGLGFVGLCLNNLLVIVDLQLTPPEVDLSEIRNIPAVVGMVIMVTGLIWDSQ